MRWKLNFMRGTVKIGRGSVVAEVPYTRGTLLIADDALARGFLALGVPGAGKSYFVSHILRGALSKGLKALIYAPKDDLARYVGENYKMAYWPAAPGGGSEFQPNLFIDAYYAARHKLKHPFLVFHEFLSYASPAEGQNKEWMQYAGNFLSLYFYMVYRSGVKVLPRRSDKIADYLPNHAEVMDRLSERSFDEVADELKAFVESLDAEERRIMAPAASAVRAYYSATYGDVKSSFSTAFALYMQALMHPYFVKSYDGSIFQLVPSAAGSKPGAEELDGIYFWQSDIGNTPNALISAYIQTYITLLFQYRNAVKGDPAILVVLDDFVTIPPIDSLAKLPNIGRAVGLWTVVTAQSLEHLKYGRSEKVDLAAAFYCILLFNTMSKDLAEFIKERIGSERPKVGLFGRGGRSGAELMATVGQIDAAVLNVLKSGTAILMCADQIYKGKTYAVVRLYGERLIDHIIKWLWT